MKSVFGNTKSPTTNTLPSPLVLGSGNDTYSFPEEAGTTNQILQYDGGGSLVWVNQTVVGPLTTLQSPDTLTTVQAINDSITATVSDGVATNTALDANPSQTNLSSSGITTNIKGPLSAAEGILSAGSLDQLTGVPLVIADTTASKVEIGRTGITTELKGKVQTTDANSIQLGSTSSVLAGKCMSTLFVANTPLGHQPVPAPARVFEFLRLHWLYGAHFSGFSSEGFRVVLGRNTGGPRAMEVSRRKTRNCQAVLEGNSNPVARWALSLASNFAGARPRGEVSCDGANIPAQETLEAFLEPISPNSSH